MQANVALCMDSRITEKKFYLKKSLHKKFQLTRIVHLCCETSLELQASHNLCGTSDDENHGIQERKTGGNGIRNGRSSLANCKNKKYIWDM